MVDNNLRRIVAGRLRRTVVNVRYPVSRRSVPSPGRVQLPVAFYSLYKSVRLSKRRSQPKDNGRSAINFLFTENRTDVGVSVRLGGNGERQKSDGDTMEAPGLKAKRCRGSRRVIYQRSSAGAAARASARTYLLA
ncbi:hypothetical protein EVAR_64253_1 [Eumeta japonica]|uniref:Uncharacterized protein n=1 Tax=Eumeta variegata TaxID=151549 RepID=A0A4C1YXD3_EUMVA|nr:hypothetical protein EVAR_64253_1 [Eumeta japonica]